MQDRSRLRSETATPTEPPTTSGSRVPIRASDPPLTRSGLLARGAYLTARTARDVECMLCGQGRLSGSRTRYRCDRCGAQWIITRERDDAPDPAGSLPLWHVRAPGRQES